MKVVEEREKLAIAQGTAANLPKKKKSKKATSKQSTKALAKKPMGRPTKYRPEYCALLIEHMAEGMPVDTFAPQIGVIPQTLYEWMDKNPEFYDAHKEGKARSYEYWINVGKRLSLGGGGNAAAWIFIMKNLHGWQNQVEIQGKIQLTPHELLLRMAEECEQDDIIDAETDDD